MPDSLRLKAKTPTRAVRRKDVCTLEVIRPLHLTNRLVDLVCAGPTEAGSITGGVLRSDLSIIIESHCNCCSFSDPDGAVRIVSSIITGVRIRRQIIFCMHDSDQNHGLALLLCAILLC